MSADTLLIEKLRRRRAHDLHDGGRVPWKLDGSIYPFGQLSEQQHTLLDGVGMRGGQLLHHLPSL